jgi:DNA-binding MarR family transcriptional regulator
MKVIKLKSKYEMLSKIIDLAITLKLPEKFSLRDREKEFLIHNILLSNEGYSLESGELVKEICKEMKIKPDDVYNYRNILKKKGWLSQTTDGFELLSVLDFSDRDIPNELEIKYKLQIGK